MDALDSVGRASREAALDVAMLVQAFAALAPDGRSRLIETSVRAVAHQRWGDEDDQDEHLVEVAKGSFPWGHQAARLVSSASDVELDALGTLFQDGPLPVVLASSDHDLSVADGVYESYRMLSGYASPVCAPPHPAECLGIDVDESEFGGWVGDRLEVDRKAYEAEVRRRCVEVIAGMVGEWRRAFFSDLVQGQ